MKSEHLFSVSPLDGRYNQAIEEFREVTSEYGLIKYRVIVEIKWFIHLSPLFGNPPVFLYFCFSVVL